MARIGRVFWVELETPAAVSFSRVRSDSAALSESASESTSYAVSDSAALTESSVLDVSGADSGTLSESVDEAVALAASDSAALAEDSSVGLDAADSAALSEAAEVGVPITGSDSGSLTESSLAEAALPASDSAAASEAASEAASYPTSDSGVLTESADVTEPRSGRVYWFEFQTPEVAAFSRSDSAALTESATVDAAFGVSDSVVLAELGAQSEGRRGRVYWLEFQTPGATSTVRDRSDDFSFSEASELARSVSDSAALTESAALEAQLSVVDVRPARAAAGFIYLFGDGRLRTLATFGESSEVDAEIAGMDIAVSDSLTLTDAASLEATTDEPLEDAGDFQETELVEAELAASDSATFSDASAAEVAQGVSDDAALTAEVAEAPASLVAADSAVLVEDAQPFLELTASDDFAVTEEPSAILEENEVTASDSLALSAEDASSAASLTSSDDAALSEEVSADREVADEGSLEEAAVALGGPEGTDFGSLSEATSISVEVSAGDSFAFGEIPLSILPQAVNVSDALAFIDAAADLLATLPRLDGAFLIDESLGDGAPEVTLDDDDFFQMAELAARILPRPARYRPRGRSQSDLALSASGAATVSPTSSGVGEYDLREEP